MLNLFAHRTSDPLNHSKFAKSPAVVRVLGEQLIAGRDIDDPDIGFATRRGGPRLRRQRRSRSAGHSYE